MGRVSQRAAIFVAALHRDAATRFLSVAGGREASRRQGLPRVLRSPARAAARARRRDGAVADGDGDRLRLPQIPEGQSDRAPPGLNRASSTSPRRNPLPPILDSLNASTPALWLEVSPPRGINPAPLLRRLGELAGHADAINLTDNALGK